MGINASFYNFALYSKRIFEENSTEKNLQGIDDRNPIKSFLKVNVKFHFGLFNPESIFMMILFLQKYKNELALLTRAYFPNINDRDAFKQNRLFFMSDLLMGYDIVKATVLQTQANYNNAALGEPKKTFLFR